MAKKNKSIDREVNSVFEDIMTSTKGEISRVILDANKTYKSCSNNMQRAKMIKTAMGFYEAARNMKVIRPKGR